MQDVLEYFLVRASGEPITYIDSWIGPEGIRRVFSRKAGKGEYVRLQRQLFRWQKAGKVKWYELDAERQPIAVTGSGRQIYFVPINPTSMATQNRFSMVEAASRITNALSIVLVLVVNCDSARCNVLLTSDATIGHIGSDGYGDYLEPIECWKEHAKQEDIEDGFRVVKVPHHGSIASHRPDLCSMKAKGRKKRVAVISAGTRKAIPDQNVIKDYLDSGWTVMVTTARKPYTYDRPVQLHLKGMKKDEPPERTIRLTLSSSGRLSSNPVQHAVQQQDLSAYETALSS